MNADQRGRVATLGRNLLPSLLDAVVDSWHDLLPAAEHWTPEQVEEARETSAAALEGMFGVFERGDLDDRTWGVVRDKVLAYGDGDIEAVGQLLRSVRLVAVEFLGTKAQRTLGLTRDNRWDLQRQAAVFCDEVLGVRAEVDAAAFDALLQALERSGPDLR